MLSERMIVPPVGCELIGQRRMIIGLLGEIIFNCALFRHFGTSEFAEAVGWQTNFNPDQVSAIAEERHGKGLRVFTGAYIIPSLGIKRPKHEAVCSVILALPCGISVTN